MHFLKYQSHRKAVGFILLMLLGSWVAAFFATMFSDPFVFTEDPPWLFWLHRYLVYLGSLVLLPLLLSVPIALLQLWLKAPVTLRFLMRVYGAFWIAVTAWILLISGTRP